MSRLRSHSSVTSLTRRTALKALGIGTGALALGKRAKASEAARAGAASGSASRLVTEKIADYILHARFEDLPPHIVEKTKAQIAFFLGRALQISRMKEGSRVRAVAQRAACTAGSASVIGEQFRLSPSDAAFANATLFGGSLSMDDVLLDADIHAGVLTLPTALALGETQRASGRELLLSLVLGYEVLGKLGGASSGQTAPFPLRSRNIFVGYGPVTVGGRLLNLDRQHLIMALDRAADMCMEVVSGSLLEHQYDLISGRGTRAVQEAAINTGACDACETNRAHFEAARGELQRMVEKLGYWEILTAVAKRHRGTSHTITAIELMADLVATSRIAVDEVCKVQAALPRPASRARAIELSLRGPYSPAARAFASLPYGLSRVLLDGRVDAEQLADERIVNDAAVAKLMPRIDVAFEDGRSARWARVAITTSDGRVLVRESDYFAIEFPPEMWGEWLRVGGRHLLSHRQLTELEQLIGNLEDLNDVSRLLMATKPAAMAGVS